MKVIEGIRRMVPRYIFFAPILTAFTMQSPTSVAAQQENSLPINEQVCKRRDSPPQISSSPPKSSPEKSSSSPKFINYELRHDQTRSHMFKTSPNHVYVCAPMWVDKMLDTLLEDCTVSELHVYDRQKSSFVSKVKSIMVNPFTTVDLSKLKKLTRLQLLSRNEEANTSGFIKMGLYTPGISDKSIILSLKDLVRQTVIVSEGQTTGYGGYRMPVTKQDSKVYICDLAALQFQHEDNSGRLVLIRENPLPAGIFDDQIFENVVGESKVSFTAADESRDDKRYVKARSNSFGIVYFDTKAYKCFVARDVVLAGLAVHHLAEAASGEFNFKFLKYGTGFFAGNFGAIIEDNILEGVLDGLDQLFGHLGETDGKKILLKSIQLPFFSVKSNLEGRISEFEKRHSIKIRFGDDDALKETVGGLTTATTNCGDPHAVFGNEMNYGSVDAAIAENLKDKGYNFCPLMIISESIKEEFFPIKSKL